MLLTLHQHKENEYYENGNIRVFITFMWQQIKVELMSTAFTEWYLNISRGSAHREHGAFKRRLNFSGVELK